MTRFIGLLRAVNIGPHNQVSMAALRNLLIKLRFDDPRTLLQSGNVVFGADKREPTDLERVLAAEVKKRLGVATDFFVRRAAEWAEIVGANPYIKEAEVDPSHLILMALKDKPTDHACQELQSAIKGSEQVTISERHAYIVYPDGIGRSKLTTAIIERKLGTRATGRNWNTVLKLQALGVVDAGSCLRPR
jgi:uncharacterized protein (DUF1697 family)